MIHQAAAVYLMRVHTGSWSRALRDWAESWGGGTWGWQASGCCQEGACCVWGGQAIKKLRLNQETFCLCKSGII